MFKAGLDDASVFEKMQVDEPYKRYKKTILGQVFVYYINPFNGNTEGKVMHGNPRRDEEGCYFSTWGPKDDAFFRNMPNNKKHFDAGRLIEAPVVAKNVVVEKSPNEFTDDEIEQLANSRFLKLQNTLNKMTSLATVQRVLYAAEDLEKSEKILDAIRKRLSELEMLDAEGKLQE